MWNYFAERLLFDTTSAALRPKPAKASFGGSSKLERARTIVHVVFGQHIRSLAHAKCKLVRIDQYGLENDDAWIQHFRNFARTTMNSALEGFNEATAQAAIHSVSPDYLEQISELVRHIRRTEGIHDIVAKR